MSTATETSDSTPIVMLSSSEAPKAERSRPFLVAEELAFTYMTRLTAMRTAAQTTSLRAPSTSTHLDAAFHSPPTQAAPPSFRDRSAPMRTMVSGSA